MLQLIKTMFSFTSGWVIENFKFVLILSALSIFAILFRGWYHGVYEKGRMDVRGELQGEFIKGIEEHRLNEAYIIYNFRGLDIEGLCDSNERDCTY